MSMFSSGNVPIMAFYAVTGYRNVSEGNKILERAVYTPIPRNEVVVCQYCQTKYISTSYNEYCCPYCSAPNKEEIK